MKSILASHHMTAMNCNCNMNLNMIAGTHGPAICLYEWDAEWDAARGKSVVVLSEVYTSTASNDWAFKI